MKINKIILTIMFTGLSLFNFVSAQNTNYINVSPTSVETIQCTTLKNSFKFKTNNKTFKSNDKNSNGEVSKLQDFLAARGHLTGVTANGNYGPATVKAVKEFQQANGLVVTGIVGKVTRDKINNELCGGITGPITVVSKGEGLGMLNRESVIAEKDYAISRENIDIKATSNINTKKLNEAIVKLEKEINSSECEKNKLDCDIAKYGLKSIKENCFKVKELEIDGCVLAAMFSAAITVSGLSQKKEMEEAGKSKEAYEKYLTKSGIDFKDGICDGLNSTISSGFENYRYVEVCKDKQKTYSFTKQLNGQEVPILRNEYVDNQYNSFLKGLPKLLETYENMSQGKISL